MTRYFLVVISLLLTQASIAAPKIYLVDNNGFWNDNDTWDLGRKPQNGDTVIIPLGKKVVVDDNINLSSSNLYIKVWGKIELDGGKLDLGNNSTIFVYVGGRIFGHNNNDKIRIGNAEKFRGNDPDIFSLATPLVANSTTGAGFSSITLPVKYISFSVTRSGNAVLVEWATAEEQDAHHYEIERSIDGTAWTTTGFVSAAGTTSVTTHYHYTDRNAGAGKFYYRIKQVDVGGRYAYTPVRTANADAHGANMTLSRTSSGVSIHLAQPLSSAVVVYLVSLTGQVIEQVVLASAATDVQLNTNPLNGIYIVSVKAGSVQLTEKIKL